MLFRVAWPNTLLSAFKLRKHRFDYLLLGNVGKNVLPLTFFLNTLKRVSHSVLIAHREGDKLSLWALRKFPISIIGVNDQITRGFSEAGFTAARTYYGEIEYEKFRQISEQRALLNSKKTKPFRFAVFGSLDPEWKGSDTAIAAFEMLPQEIREQSELHLAAFAHNKPKCDTPGVILYDWLEPKKVPEFLAGADVLLVPSRDNGIMKETFSQSMVQGMLSGLAIICTPLPILTEKIVSGGGLIAKNAEEMSSQMRSLYEDRELCNRLGKEAQEIALRQYCWKTEDFAQEELLNR